jgi:hypothetical protein
MSGEWKWMHVPGEEIRMEQRSRKVRNEDRDLSITKVVALRIASIGHIMSLVELLMIKGLDH